MLGCARSGAAMASIPATVLKPATRDALAQHRGDLVLRLIEEDLDGDGHASSPPAVRPHAVDRADEWNR